MFFWVIPTGINICCGHCRKISNAAGGDVNFFCIYCYTHSFLIKKECRHRNGNSNHVERNSSTCTIPCKSFWLVSSSRILHSLNFLTNTNVLINILLIHVSTCTMVYFSNGDSSSRSNHAICLWDSPTQNGLALHRLLPPVVWHHLLLSGVLYQLFLSVVWIYLLLSLVRYQLFP